LSTIELTERIEHPHKEEGTVNASAATGSKRKTRVKTIGFGRRLVSTLWDGLLIFFMSFILIIVIAFVEIFAASFMRDSELPITQMTFWTGIFLSLLYYVGMWTTSGQTIGKATLGIKVVGKNGKPLPVGRALLRWIGFIISGVVFSLGFLWININKQRRGWHDIIAGSYVVEADADFTDISQVEIVPSDTGKGWVWILIWVLVAISPIGLGAVSLFLLSPYVNTFITNILDFRG
jgi:uncharacterized RDD family membrane protein YckC